MERLNGKVAVITGGGSGIGLGAARRFVDEGAFVYLFGRRQEVLDRAAAQLGGRAHAVAGSVSEIADLDRLFATVRAEHGRIDILFANAGTGDFTGLGEITGEQIDKAFDTNVKGLIFTVQQALPLMGKGGSIILTGSSAATRAAPRFSVYSATKAAIRSLARGWAEDLRGTGIRVNVLSPGPIRTDLAMELVGEAAMSEMVRTLPLERIGEVEETAAAAAFLASDDSSFMTGSDLAVDGGIAQV